MHDVVIRRVTNGVSVNIGCLAFVFEDVNRAMAEVQAYLLDPRAAEKRWDPVIVAHDKRLRIDVTGPPALRGYDADETACEPDRARPDIGQASVRSYMGHASRPGDLVSGGSARNR